MPESLGAVRARILIGIVCCGTIAVGLSILLGGSLRFSSAGFMVARQLAPWWLWGTVLTVAGLMSFLGLTLHSLWLCRIGHAVSAVAYAFLVFTFVQSALAAPTVAFTGISIYGCLAVLHSVGAATADMTPAEADWARRR